MAKTREIKGRIRAVSNIQRITKTMQMIATARFQAAQKRATASKPYTRKISELVGELAAVLSKLGQGQGDGTAISHPLLKAPAEPTHKRLLLVVTSNRGLCGGYNSNVLRKAVAFLRSHTNEQIDLEVIGRKGLAYFKFTQVPVAQSLSQFTDKPQYAQVDELAQRYMKLFTQGQYDSVHVIYMSYLSMSRQVPAVLDLLPLQPPQQPVDAARQSNAEVTYDFTPSPDLLLQELLPMTVKTQLFQAINEAVVGEQIARMVAMKAATDAAGKMKKHLTNKFNRARQTAITTELSEIIGGAAALS